MSPEELEATRRIAVPAGALKITAKAGDVTIYAYTDRDGRPCVRTFWGRSAKCKDRFYFHNEAQRTAYVDRVLRGAAAAAEAKQKRKADRKAAGRGVSIGDVLRTCWGYEQTNIEWFEVTALVGDTMVEVREIACEIVETHWLQGKTAPVPGRYIGESLRRRAVNGAVKIDDVRTAWREEPLQVIGGKPVFRAAHFTAYH